MGTKPPLKWPPVANRHRMEAIMRLGEIINETKNLNSRLYKLLKSVDDGNILLANAIAHDAITRVRLIAEVALSAQTTLETAPAGPPTEEDTDE